MRFMSCISIMKFDFMNNSFSRSCIWKQTILEYAFWSCLNLQIYLISTGLKHASWNLKYEILRIYTGCWEIVTFFASLLVKMHNEDKKAQKFTCIRYLFYIYICSNIRYLFYIKIFKIRFENIQIWQTK